MVTVMANAQPSTAPWTDDDLRALKASAGRIGTTPRALIGMLLSESEAYPNPSLMHGVRTRQVPVVDPTTGAIIATKTEEIKPNAVGLNQILLTLLPTSGFKGDWKAYESLSVGAQLVYVERWIQARPGKKDTASALYLSNFLPGYMAHAHDDRFLLCSRPRETNDKPTDHRWGIQPQWYTPNWHAFDPWLTKAPPPRATHGEKGYIEVADLGARIERVLATARGKAFLAALDRLDADPHAPTEPAPPRASVPPPP